MFKSFAALKTEFDILNVFNASDKPTSQTNVTHVHECNVNVIVY